MTEERAIEVLEIMKSQLKDFGMTAKFKGVMEMQELAIDIALKSLTEIQQYRAIGTVEEIKDILQIISEGQDDVDESGISTGLLHTLLEYAEYKKTGTVEECREARERQRVKDIIHNTDGGVDEDWLCPTCGKFCSPYFKHCQHCGQDVKAGNAP